MKNFLTQWETEKENQKIGGNMMLINRKLGSNMLLINRELAKLEDDSEYTPLRKLIELVKKSSNLIKTREKKPHCPISHSFACFIKPVRWTCFCFAKFLTSLTDGLAIGRVELRRKKVAIGFSG